MPTTPRSITMTATYAGFACTGAPAGDFSRALRALVADQPDATAAGNLTLLVEGLALELRAAGHAVDVVVGPDTLVRHGCGHTWRAAEWAAHPHYDAPMLATGKRPGTMQMRRCRCGSDIALSGCTLARDPACTPRDLDEAAARVLAALPEPLRAALDAAEHLDTHLVLPPGLRPRRSTPPSSLN